MCDAFILFLVPEIYKIRSNNKKFSLTFALTQKKKHKTHTQN